VLERLDTLSGRIRDNAGFFSAEHIGKIGDTELYRRLRSEIPNWLRGARTAGIVR